jgi:hypothetical protein
MEEQKLFTGVLLCVRNFESEEVCSFCGLSEWIIELMKDITNRGLCD